MTEEEIKNEKAKDLLKKIVEFVHPDREKGYHMYPTHMRDEAVTVLKDLGVKLSSYEKCEFYTRSGLRG